MTSTLKRQRDARAEVGVAGLPRSNTVDHPQGMPHSRFEDSPHRAGASRCRLSVWAVVLQNTADAGGEAVIPSCLHQDASRMAVATLGDRPEPTGTAAGVLRGYEPEECHQLAWMSLNPTRFIEPDPKRTS